MKRILSIFLVMITLVSALSLFSCSKASIDITYKSNVYSDLSDWINNPDKYTGKSVALNATYTVVYSFADNKIIRHTLVAYDKTGQKRALYEIRKEDGIYPAIGSKVTVVGTITKNKFINVESITGGMEEIKVDHNTISMSAAELKSFVEAYRNEYSASSYYGKKISIFGHVSSHDNYHFLIGLDADGKYVWEIELYDPTGSITFPKAEGTTVNPVQVIGELTTYVEDNVTYACIKVERVVSVESVFKTSATQN